MVTIINDDDLDNKIHPAIHIYTFLAFSKVITTTTTTTTTPTTTKKEHNMVKKT